MTVGGVAGEHLVRRNGCRARLARRVKGGLGRERDTIVLVSALLSHPFDLLQAGTC